MGVSKQCGMAAVMVLGLTAIGHAAPPPLPTMGDISGLLDKGDWNAGLQAISRVMDLRGTAAAAYDQQKLLMWRAECDLQLHNRSAAIATLNLVKKNAKDATEAAEPTALLELIQKSPGGMYTPKGPGHAPISILDRDHRKDAYAALAADELTALQAQVKNVSHATSLPPLVQVGKAAAPVRALEIAATGKATDADAVTAELAALAQKLMTDALNTLSQKVEAISTSANRQISVTTAMNLGGGRGAIPVQQLQPVGLTGSDTQTLRNIEKECDEFPPAALQLGEAFGDDQGFSAIGTRAKQIKSRADTVLNASYIGNGMGAPGLLR